MYIAKNRKQIVKERCANFNDGICLVRGIACPLVTAYEYRGHQFPTEEAECGYFDKYVLGEKEKADNSNIKRYSFKDCSYCGIQYRPSSNASRYCSEACREVANKKAHRKYNAKRKLAK